MSRMKRIAATVRSACTARDASRVKHHHLDTKQVLNPIQPNWPASLQRITDTAEAPEAAYEANKAKL